MSIWDRFATGLAPSGPSPGCRPVYVTGTGAVLPGAPFENGLMDGRRLHSNASLCADAVRLALNSAGLGREHLTCLAAATGQGDPLVPSHASAVQGELGGGALELASFESDCGASLMAAKYAWISVRTGDADCAATVAGEVSPRGRQPEVRRGGGLVDAGGRPHAPADFPPLTLSDGAGAAILEGRPRPGGQSLRVDWIDLASLAGRIDPLSVDHLLCHYSANSLREEIVQRLQSTLGMVPEARWFATLPESGNLGSGSIWMMLDALIKAGRLRTGEKILCIVPESGRVSAGFMMFEVVEAD